jgi:hypothetical protein
MELEVSVGTGAPRGEFSHVVQRNGSRDRD